MDTKLKKGDKIIINSTEYFGTPKGRYKVVDIFTDRKANINYVLKHDRNNATTRYSLYASDVDKDLRIPTLEELENCISLAFLNFSDIIFYDEKLIQKIKTNK